MKAEKFRKLVKQMMRGTPERRVLFAISDPAFRWQNHSDSDCLFKLEQGIDKLLQKKAKSTITRRLGTSDNISVLPKQGWMVLHPTGDHLVEVVTAEYARSLEAKIAE